MPGSIWARYAARISLVEIGSRPGLMRGPMMPPSMTMVSFGAWRCWARAAASSGTPTPANTVVSSRSCRELLADGRFGAAGVDGRRVFGEVVEVGVIEEIGRAHV